MIIARGTAGQVSGGVIVSYVAELGSISCHRAVEGPVTTHTVQDRCRNVSLVFRPYSIHQQLPLIKPANERIPPGAVGGL